MKSLLTLCSVFCVLVAFGDEPVAPKSDIKQDSYKAVGKRKDVPPVVTPAPIHRQPIINSQHYLPGYDEKHQEQVAKESLEESLDNLASDPLVYAEMKLPMNSNYPWPNEIAALYRDDPRIKKVLDWAVSADFDGKRALVTSIAQRLERILDQFDKLDEAAIGSSLSFMDSTEIKSYVFLLGELDTEALTLPLLVRAYDAQREKAISIAPPEFKSTPDRIHTAESLPTAHACELLMLRFAEDPALKTLLNEDSLTILDEFKTYSELPRKHSLERNSRYRVIMNYAKSFVEQL